MRTYGNFNDFVTFTRSSGGTALRPISYGTELVTNGTFDNGTTDWTPQGDVLLSVVNGELVLNRLASGFVGYQIVTTEVGKIYQATATARASATTDYAYFRGGIGVAAVDYANLNTPSKTPTALTFSFVAQSTTTYISLGSGNAGDKTVYFDNVSVREVFYDQAGAPLTLFNHPANTPRIEYNAAGERLGLLVEEARTNLVTYSEDFSNAYWNAISSSLVVTANSTSSPDGTTTADTVTLSNAYRLASVSGSVTNGVTYTYSVWLRSASGTVSVGLYRGGVIDVVTVTEEWQQFSTTFEYTATPYIGIDQRPASATKSGDIYIWGAQLEVGAFPTSYIPTSGATATRARDNCIINISAFGFNAAAGTFVAAFDYTDPSETNANYVLGGNASSRIMYNNPSSNYWQTFDGTSSASFQGIDGDGEANKLAVTVATGKDIATAKNGSLITTSTSGTALLTNVAATGTASIGGGSATQMLNGHIKSIQYIPRRLTNAQLQELTQ